MATNQSTNWQLHHGYLTNVLSLLLLLVPHPLYALAVNLELWMVDISSSFWRGVKNHHLYRCHLLWTTQWASSSDSTWNNQPTITCEAPLQRLLAGQLVVLEPFLGFEGWYYPLTLSPLSSSSMVVTLIVLLFVLLLLLVVIVYILAVVQEECRNMESSSATTQQTRRDTKQRRLDTNMMRRRWWWWRRRRQFK